MNVDRRAFLAAAAALPAVGRVGVASAAGAPAAKQQIVRRGRALAVVGRRVVIAHDRRRTIGVGGHVIDVGGMPVDVAISPDGKLAAVTTGFWDDPGLAIVDLLAARVLGRVDVGPAPGAVVFTGLRRVLVAGGEQEGTATVVDARTRSVLAQRAIGRVPRGAAAYRGDAWIALTGDDEVVQVDGRSARIERTVRTGALPDRVATDGRQLLISHATGEHVTLAAAKKRRIKVGGHVSGVAFTRGGRPVVALPGAIKVLGGKRHAVGAAPRDLVVVGRRAFTVDDLTGALSKVKL